MPIPESSDRVVVYKVLGHHGRENTPDLAFIKSTFEANTWHGVTFVESHVAGENADVFIVFLTNDIIMRTFGDTFTGFNVCQMTQPGIIAINDQRTPGCVPHVRPPARDGALPRDS
jgi:hypothetical protein